MVGECQLLLVLAELPSVQTFNSVFEQREDGGCGPVKHEVQFETFLLLRGTLVAGQNLDKEGERHLHFGDRGPSLLL